jgi:hypothetical protein
MNIRSPAELYIKYLLCHPDKYSKDAIKKCLEELDVYYLGDDYVDALRRQMVIPEPFRPENKMHQKSHRFLLAHNIRSLFHPTHDTKIALRLIETPRVKEFIETMLLSHAPAAAISSRVIAMGTTCTSGAIEEFKKYFWNVDLLTATQFRVLLHMQLNQSVEDSDSATTKTKKGALKKASYLDPRKLASELPNSPITALMAQMRMGVMPNKLELGTIVQAAQAMGSLKVLEAVMFGSPQDSGRALNYSIVVKNMTEVLESVVKPDEHLREQLQAIALRTETADVPSIHQLSGGKHTVDVLPTQAQVSYEPVESEQDGSVDSSVADRQE